MALNEKNVPGGAPWAREIIERYAAPMWAEIEAEMKRRGLLIYEVTDWSDPAMERKRDHRKR